MNPEKPHPRAARLLTNILNPFFVFTALYVFVAFSETTFSKAVLYIAAELAAAALVAGYVFLLQRSGRVRNFWISSRTERLVPALVLLSAFIALLGALTLLGAPGTLLATTLSMGLASAFVAAITLLWKASAHAAVAGHATVAGLLVLGPASLVFVLVLPAVLWSRIAAGAHTPAQALVGAGVGAAFALLFLA